MKSIKKAEAICLMVFLVLSSSIFAQRKVDETYRLNRSEVLSLNFRFPESITIKHWERQEVNIQADVVINEGKNNEAFKLIAERESGGLSIQSEIDNIEKLCKRENSKYDYSSPCIEISMIIYLPKGADIELETISGNIEIEDHDGAMKIKSIGGFVDLAINPRASADIELKTIGGEIYSDLEIPAEDSMRKIAGYEVEHRLNRGGRRVFLESIGGNIYLRKR